MVKISTLTPDGSVAGTEGDVLDLDFSSDITVDGADQPGDGRGFDDDLSAVLCFDTW